MNPVELNLIDVVNNLMGNVDIDTDAAKTALGQLNLTEASPEKIAEIYNFVGEALEARLATYRQMEEELRESLFPKATGVTTPVNVNVQAGFDLGI